MRLFHTSIRLRPSLGTPDPSGPTHPTRNFLNGPTFLPLFVSSKRPLGVLLTFSIVKSSIPPVSVFTHELGLLIPLGLLCSKYSVRTFYVKELFMLPQFRRAPILRSSLLNSVRSTLPRCGPVSDKSGLEKRCNSPDFYFDESRLSVTHGNFRPRLQVKFSLNEGLVTSLKSTPNSLISVVEEIRWRLSLTFFLRLWYQWYLLILILVSTPKS